MSSFPVKAIVLDWAGTVVDFGCMAPVRALIEVFGEDGFVLTDAEARADMGKAKIDHLRAILAAADVAERWRVTKGALPAEEGADCRHEFHVAQSHRLARQDELRTIHFQMRHVFGIELFIAKLQERG